MPYHSGNLYGKFKKVLFFPDQVHAESFTIKQELLELENFYFQKRFSDVNLVFLFIILFLSNRSSKNWFQFQNKQSYSNFPKTYLEIKNQILEGEFSVPEFLNRVFFKNLPYLIPKSLLHWNSHPSSLVLIDFLPSSEEMLDIQSQGKRYITICFQSALDGKLIEDKRDAFEFLLHDLAHAYTFFQPENLPEEQIIFFQTLKMHYSEFLSFCKSDPQFEIDFQYCLSDMNSHPAHLQEYLRAKLIDYFRRKGNSKTYLNSEEKKEFDDFWKVFTLQKFPLSH